MITKGTNNSTAARGGTHWLLSRQPSPAVPSTSPIQAISINYLRSGPLYQMYIHMLEMTEILGVGLVCPVMLVGVSHLVKQHTYIALPDN